MQWIFNRLSFLDTQFNACMLGKHWRRILLAFYQYLTFLNIISFDPISKRWTPKIYSLTQWSFKVNECDWYILATTRELNYIVWLDSKIFWKMFRTNINWKNFSQNYLTTSKSIFWPDTGCFSKLATSWIALHTLTFGVWKPFTMLLNSIYVTNNQGKILTLIKA